MIRPTIRTVLIFAGAIPLSLIAVIYDPGSWPIAASYGILVLVFAASDLMLALYPGMLEIRTSTPEKLYIGERGAVTAEVSAVRYRRSVDLDVIADERGDL